MFFFMFFFLLQPLGIWELFYCFEKWGIGVPTSNLATFPKFVAQIPLSCQFSQCVWNQKLAISKQEQICSIWGGEICLDMACEKWPFVGVGDMAEKRVWSIKDFRLPPIGKAQDAPHAT